jgi:signal transduction histidine kinase
MTESTGHRSDELPEQPPPTRAGDGQPATDLPSMPTARWMSFTFVIFSLVVLAVVPIVVGARVRAMRRDMTDVEDPAVAALGQYTIAIANESLARRGSPTDAASYESAAASERDATAVLDTLMRRLGPEAARQYAALQALAADWHRAGRDATAATTVWRDDTSRGLVDPGQAEMRLTSAARWRAAVVIVAAAAMFGQSLMARSSAQRMRIRRLERLDILLPVLLVPLALASVAVVLGIERRTLRLADDAYRGRTALAESIASKAALLRGVAHDLRNPLGAALSYSELLADDHAGPLTPPQREIVNRMRGLMGSTLESVTDMLELSRMDAIGPSITPMSVDLPALLRGAIVDHAALAAQADIEIELELVSDAIDVETDPMRVSHILADLICNALKYTPSGGRIQVSMRATDASGGDVRDGRPEHVWVTVSDSGPGVLPEDRHHIFEEFVRGAAVARSVPGSGVGLSASRRMARLLRGDITVGTSVWGGAAFTLALPGRSMRGHPARDGAMLLLSADFNGIGFNRVGDA